MAKFTERTFAHLHRMSARFHTRREAGAIVRDVQKGADGIGFLLGVALFDSSLNYDTVKYFATEETETRRLSEVLEQWVHARTANHFDALGRRMTCRHGPSSSVFTQEFSLPPLEIFAVDSIFDFAQADAPVTSGALRFDLFVSKLAGELERVSPFASSLR